MKLNETGQIPINLKWRLNSTGLLVYNGLKNVYMYYSNMSKDISDLNPKQ